MLHQNTVELAVEINFISDKLKSSLNCIQKPLLHDKLLDIIDFSTQVLDALAKPDFRIICSFTSYLRYENFDLVVKLFWCRLQFVFNDCRVEL